MNALFTVTTAITAHSEISPHRIVERALVTLSSPNGALDYANCDGVGGWALDMSNLSQTVTVDIYVDGTKVGSTQANGDRQDLVGAFGNSAARYHGFKYSFPANASWRNGQSHSISVRISGVSNDIMSSPRTVSGCTGGITNPPPPPPPPSNCAYTEGQFLLNWYGEQIYAHYYNGVLYASYQNASQGFKPRSWLQAAGFDASKLACFAASDPHTSNPPPQNPNPTSTPAQAGANFVGYLDGADCNAISGWVVNKNTPNKSTKFDVYINGWLVAVGVPATLYRQDVANALGISGYNAFGFYVPVQKSLKTGSALYISVKYHGTQTNIPGSPRTTAACPVDPLGCSNDGAARIVQAESNSYSRTDGLSLKLSNGNVSTASSLTSKLIPVRKGDKIFLDAYAYAPNLSKPNHAPQIATAIVGGVLAGVALTQSQDNIPDPSSHSLKKTPLLGVSSAMMIPLIKSLVEKRLPNASIEVAFYNQHGKFVYRQQVRVNKESANQDVKNTCP